jgi:PAS domain S-box-containing protein
VEGVVTLDSRGHITYFSHGTERITGQSRDAVLGCSCDEVFRLEGAEGTFSQLIPAPGRVQKISLNLADGRNPILAVSGARLLPPEAESARVALVFRDVSEEEAMRRLLGHFLANITHEFRTPLTALSASTELLMDAAADLSAEELQSLLNSLHLGVARLQTLVDNLLEGASIEAGRFRVYPRPCEVDVIVDEAVRTLGPLLEKHNQILEVKTPADLPLVWADPRRAVQVMVNLLANANKYSPDNTTIRIRTEEAEGWLTICVSDEGPGIPEDRHRDLFRKFTRVVPEGHPGPGGAGLGLSVVKAIVEALGGQVGIRAAKPHGSVFWFSLRVVEAEEI